MLYLLVGNSGSGKTTIRNILEKRGLKKIITYTTRPIRPGEKDGEDYNFINREKFLNLYNRGEFIGPTKYAGNFYATLKEDLFKAYSSKEDALIIVDQFGVKEIKKEFPQATCIYLYVDGNLLKDRMKKRGDKEESINERLKDLFDYTPLCDYKIDSSGEAENVSKEIEKIIKNGRSERIWTSGFMVPNHARYQTALHPDVKYIL